MDLITLAVIALGLVGFSVFSGKLQGTIITAPLVFIVFGFAIGEGGFSIAQLDLDHGAIHLLAEATLILVLFSDAARIDLSRLRKDHNLPVRMLALGLPLVMVTGMAVAMLLFEHFSIWEAALLAAILAPTDAALGQAVVSDEAVPVRIRQAINVESGLNDGIALPVVLFLASAASAAQQSSTGDWLAFAAGQLILGPIVGAAIGFCGARALDVAAEREWSTTAFQGIGVISVALLAFVVAELVGGNGFIAAFIGGMVFGNSVRHPCTFLFEFMATEGELLVLITFLVLGAVMLPDALQHLNWTWVLYATLSLTLVRMIPIGLSLLGTGIRLPSYLFLGWFGPRGLASILFALLILEDAELVHGHELLSVTIITVVLSALLHGITAAPLAKAYGKMTRELGDCEEHRPTEEHPLRDGPPETMRRKLANSRR
ncbi:MAG: sodium:proton antiporter [Gammaproteobacteria bacterium]|nr:MAG: sodium:proton antiporter [Gammaproteobacteria bacterium]